MTNDKESAEHCRYYDVAHCHRHTPTTITDVLDDGGNTSLRGRPRGIANGAVTSKRGRMNDATMITLTEGKPLGAWQKVASRFVGEVCP